jgi:DNA-binding transcriptional LysR family regulator
MNANLRHVRAFLAVARHGSFTRAAHELHVSQPALTVQIRQLESSLGLQLFDRNTRSVEITRAGRELAGKLERLQVEFDEVLAEARDMAAGQRGVVRLACLQSFAATVLPQAIARFQQRHPQVVFSVKDASGGRTQDMVRDGAVDFGVADLPAHEPQLEFTPLLCARLHAVLPPGHELEKSRRITLARLGKYPLILMDRETRARALVDAAFAAAGVKPTGSCEVVALSTALAMVRYGAGVTVLPVSARDAHAGVSIRPIADHGVPRWIGLLRRSGRSLPPASEAFIGSLLADWKEG